LGAVDAAGGDGLMRSKNSPWRHPAQDLAATPTEAQLVVAHEPAGP